MKQDPSDNSRALIDSILVVEGLLTQLEQDREQHSALDGAIEAIDQLHTELEQHDAVELLGFAKVIRDLLSALRSDISLVSGPTIKMVLDSLGELRAVLAKDAARQATPALKSLARSMQQFLADGGPRDDDLLIAGDDGFELDRELLMQILISDSTESIQAVEELLMQLERQPKDQEVQTEILRRIHTIKGEASCVELVAIPQFAHVMEDVLGAIADGEIPVNRSLITTLLDALDGLRSLIDKMAEGVDQLEPRHQLLSERLKAVMETGSALEQTPVKLEDDAAIDGGGAGANTLRVPIDRLDQLLNLTGEVLINRGRMGQMLEDPTGQSRADMLDAHREADQVHLELQELVMTMRMVSIGPVFRRYIRTVRDISNAHQKLARLELKGADVEIDTAVVDQLRGPLTHIIRNAIDHGIELPEVRKAKGKDPCGCITMAAERQGANIVISVSDDGAGLDRERILQRATQLGLVSNPEQLDGESIDRLIFESGLSTAEQVTDLSGRGVGMDVVQQNIKAIRGKITISSEPGVGATITMRLPLTLTLIGGFGVGVGGETYVIPMASVVECLEMPAHQRNSNKSQGIIDLRGTPLPYVKLADYYGVPAKSGEKENIVVVQDGDTRIGLAVEALYGESQTVIKPLAKMFQDVTGIVGSAILGNGRVALILDVPVLVDDVLKQADMESAKRSNGNNHSAQAAN